ncbi:MAG TPA: cell division protein FtsZ, partial [Solirubrobacteraceae bacterium]|nr:cell division protein FtsZ [Solirubrobacteraceae bacterium]
MANAKRASMREGPLAALFRKTEGDEGEPERAVAAPVEETPAVSAPQTPAAAHPRESGLPHPALGAAEQAPAETPRIPSPQERLRHAFSSEIPENVMEPAPARPVMDDYARAHPEVSGTAGPTGQPVIRVVGVGGAGVNAVNRMVEAEVEGVEFLAVNTDVQSLQQSTADITLHIGAELTRGLGAGSDANVGRQSAMEDYDRLKALLKGSDMIFITAGAGGGTGTGAAPVVARIAREVGALTVAIVTKPFGFEGSRRSGQAEQAVASPLLETSMEGARSILLSITGGRDMSLWEVNESAKAVAEAAHPDANIIFGAMVDEKLDDQVWVTVVATGYTDGRRRSERMQERPA